MISDKKISKLKQTSPFEVLKSGKIKNGADIKTLMRRLISGFCRGEISGTDAKVLAYLCNTYGQLENLLPDNPGDKKTTIEVKFLSSTEDIQDAEFNESIEEY